jgi:AcrR family transcriptional regulator
MTTRTPKRSAGRRPHSPHGDLNTRAEVLSAARTVFARRGFAAASMREVADAARVNKAMIYYHFRDKQDLYRAVLADSLAAMREVWSDEVFSRKASAREKIERFIDGFVRFQSRNEELRHIFMMEYYAHGTKSANIKWIAKEYFAKEHAALVAILREGMRSGELKRTDPRMAVMMLFGMISHSFLFQPLASYVHGRRVVLSPRRLSAFVAETFFNGIGAS